MLTNFVKSATICVNETDGGCVMKYLCKELREQYDIAVKECDEIGILQHPLIGVGDVLRAYFILADYFTDDSGGAEVEKMLVGLRSKDLLSSALCRQVASFGGKVKFTADLDICATLFYGLVKNHAFFDGNKRVSLLILLYQLNLYGYLPQASTKEFEKLVLAVAANELESKYNNAWKKFKKQQDKEIKTIAYLLRHMVKRKDHSYHVLPTMKEFIGALEGAGITARLENGKIHLRRDIKRPWLLKSETINYSINFAGWSRSVGAKTARDVLQTLKIYEQYPDYQDFLDGKEPMYQIVEQFEVPLRRLKDE